MSCTNSRLKLRVATCLPFFVMVLAVFLAVVAAGTGTAWGGGGPENLLLIVNPRSADSLAIANHYVTLRGIPSRNVVFIPWDPQVQRTDVETFRDKILKPIYQQIRVGRLESQVDYLVYSSDYPTAIDASADVKRFLSRDESSMKPPARGSLTPTSKKTKKEKTTWPKTLTQVGSLTGMTYLGRLVMSGRPDYLGLATNWYCGLSLPGQPERPSQGFSSQTQFAPDGTVLEKGGRRYILSAMLGVPQNKERRGNTRSEILDYLCRAVEADGTCPEGTVYFVDNHEVRSRTRKPKYSQAIKALSDMGVEACQVDHAPPVETRGIAGLMMGKARFDAGPMARAIRPGAICDNLTSFGGDMRASASQTPLTEFLRYGAAGSCGTVIEPYALPAKFSDPMLFVHYARGCSLAEAYYQSVYGPYQLLIVGEPLCRPWAKIPQVDLEGLTAGAKVSGKISLKPKITLFNGAEADHCEWFVNGFRFGRTGPSEGVAIDTALLPDGYHELRLVAIGPSPIYTQGRVVLPFRSENHGRSIEAWLSPPKVVRFGQPLVVTAKCSGAEQIEVYYHRRPLGKMVGPSGQVEIDSTLLGEGNVSLRVVGRYGNQPRDCVIARPLDIRIESRTN